MGASQAHDLILRCDKDIRAIPDIWARKDFPVSRSNHNLFRRKTQKTKVKRHGLKSQQRAGICFFRTQKYFLSCVASLTGHTEFIVTLSMTSFDYQRMPDHA
jgi:hypothetical protein